MPGTIFWTVAVSICFWVLIYAAVLLGFVLHPSVKRLPPHPAVGALGYATAIWLFCVGVFFVGFFFTVLLIAVVAAPAFVFLRQTSTKCETEKR
jgi:hypothetical protein